MRLNQMFQIESFMRLFRVVLCVVILTVTWIACREFQSGLVFIAGVSLALWVWVFVPVIQKFYLSELLLIIVALGVEGTVFMNAARHPAEGVDQFFALAIAPMAWPLMVFLFINWRRKPEERVTGE